MFTAGAVALIAFATPLETIAVASAKGVWDAIFILYVVWPALLPRSPIKGGYDALRQGITRFSRNELLIVIALGWAFSSFLQDIAGFGTPIAFVAPFLVAFGVRRVYAVAIPIIAHLVGGVSSARWESAGSRPRRSSISPTRPQRRSNPDCCSSFPAWQPTRRTD